VQERELLRRVVEGRWVGQVDVEPLLVLDAFLEGQVEQAPVDAVCQRSR